MTFTLRAFLLGDRGVCREVVTPSPEQEDAKRLSRERTQLAAEKTRYRGGSRDGGLGRVAFHQLPDAARGGPRRGRPDLQAEAAQHASQAHLHVEGLPLAMSAALPDEEVEEVPAQAAPEIEARYPRYSPAMLRDAVARTREFGYALNPGLVEPESWDNGVAVLDRQGRCEGALPINAIQSRPSPEARQRELATPLRGEAQRLAGYLARPDGAGDLASVACRSHGAAAA